MASKKTCLDLVVSNSSMTETEWSTFMEFSEEIVQTVDPMTFVPSLFNLGNIDKSVYEAVQRRFLEGHSRISIMEDVVKHVPSVTSFPSVIFCLDKSGYHGLSARLFLRLMQTSDKLYRMHRSEVRDRTKLHRLTRNLKRMVHDAQFKNPREALRTMAKRFRSQLESETDALKRQHLADTCVAVLGVEIDAHYDSLACKMEITQEEMLEEMRQIVPFTSNPLVSDTVYYSRHANLDAYHGDFCHGSDMLVQARSSAHSIGSCLELINMLYIEVYVKLWEFENEPSKQLLDAIMMWGRIGLESLENESSETKEMWSRMFILRMVFALLGIGNRANIISTAKVDSGSLQMAQSLLASVDTQWTGIETRREMFYCVARARLFEQLAQYSDAKLYIGRAKSLAEHGQFLEKIPFIDDFKASLEGKICDSEIDPTGEANGHGSSCCVRETDGKDVRLHIQSARINNRQNIEKREVPTDNNTGEDKIRFNSSQMISERQKNSRLRGTLYTDNKRPVQVQDKTAVYSSRLKTFDCHLPETNTTDIKEDIQLLNKLGKQATSSSMEDEPRLYILKDSSNDEAFGLINSQSSSECENDDKYYVKKIYKNDGTEPCNENPVLADCNEYQVLKIKLEDKTITDVEQVENQDVQMFVLKSELESKADYQENSLTKLKLSSVSSEHESVENEGLLDDFQKLVIEEAIFPHRESFGNAVGICPVLDKAHGHRNIAEPILTGIPNADLDEGEDSHNSCTKLKLTKVEHRLSNLKLDNQMHEAPKLQQHGTVISVTTPLSDGVTGVYTEAEHFESVSTEAASTDLTKGGVTINTLLKHLCNETIRFPSEVLFESRGEPEGISREPEPIIHSAYVTEQFAGSHADQGDNLCRGVSEQSNDLNLQHSEDLFNVDDIDDEALFGDGE